MKCRSYSAAVERYGRVYLASGAWPDEPKWMRLFSIPEWVDRWINSATGYPTRRIYCNKDIHEPLRMALDHLRNRDLLHELDTFDGCFNIRPVRGSSQVSTHAYGLAIDLNAKANPLDGHVSLSPAFVACWTDAGWDWGGTFKRRDGMHFSYAWEGRQT